MNPLPDVSDACDILIQEENQRESINHVFGIHENVGINVRVGQSINTGNNRFTGSKER